jgi:ABC-type transport system involved in Fe-S cluster assembly fused permease/ATPase subunit
MTEDDEWDAAERWQKQAKMIAARRKAVDAAYKLAQEYKDSLAHFSILKAFELGYMEAHRDE